MDLKKRIQEAILLFSTPSGTVHTRDIFSAYKKFILTGPLRGDLNHTCIVFNDGPLDSFEFKDDAGHHVFRKGLSQSDTRMHVGRLDIITEREDWGIWFNTEDFTLPEVDLPKIHELMEYPALPGTDIGGVDLILEEGLDEYVRCGYYELDSEKVFEFSKDRFKLEVILQKTTDHQKYGTILYVMMLDKDIVGFAKRHGRYLDTNTIYPTNIGPLQEFMTELEYHCREPYDFPEEEYSLHDPISKIIDGYILDDLVAGNTPNDLS